MPRLPFIQSDWLADQASQLLDARKHCPSVQMIWCLSYCDTFTPGGHFYR